ncbi:MAG: radical SAM protein [Dehalococcoidales bacterium]|nr:radical SAM protein [Dehalococcoidales bacterium]
MTGQRVWFYVNFECNLACTYCVANSDWHIARPRLPLSAFRGAVDEAAALGYAPLAVTGGEPFLHPDILPILEYAVSRMDTVVLTNASLFGSRRLARLRELSRERLTV